jgi:hypothetical protein
MDWQTISDSSWVRAIAYEAASEQIFVEFLDGHQHVYDSCSMNDWEDFSAPGTSQGAFIHSTLNRHPHRPA